MCTESSKLTHAHVSGVNNAVLQAMAIQLALTTEKGKLNPVDFVDQLLEKIAPFEEGKFDEKDSDSQEPLSQMSVSDKCHINNIIYRIIVYPCASNYWQGYFNSSVCIRGQSSQTMWATILHLQAEATQSISHTGQATQHLRGSEASRSWSACWYIKLE